MYNITDNEYLTYITMQFRHILKPEEVKALRRFAWPQEKNENDLQARTKQEILLGFDDHDTNTIVELGQEKALQKIITRVLDEHGVNLINLCPNCKQLARTPLAKQCRHCLHNWH